MKPENCLSDQFNTINGWGSSRRKGIIRITENHRGYTIELKPQSKRNCACNGKVQCKIFFLKEC